MGLALRQVWVYVKLLTLAAVGVLILLVVWNNRHHTVDVWFFGDYPEVHVVWLTLITSVASIIGWWGFRKVFGVVREMRQLNRLKQEERRADEQRRMAQELAEREKRIDEKVRRSITEEA